MTKYILFNLTEKKEAAEFFVAAVINDFGPKNVRLWNELVINIENTCFTNPVASERQIYAFAGALHLLQLIRNICF